MSATTDAPAWCLYECTVMHRRLMPEVHYVSPFSDLIHWEALRLWVKRVPFRMKEADPQLQTGVFRARE